MRTTGTSCSGRGFASHDHLCWIYDDQQSMLDAAREFLREGVAMGHRIGYIGGVGVAQMSEEISRMVRDAGRPDNAGFVADLADMYRWDEIVSPPGQVEAYAAATADALRDGFTGLRVAADATDLARSPAQRDAFTRYEHLIDRCMLDVSFSAMCAYDRSSLGADAAAELSCMHPSCNIRLTSFAVFAGADEGFVLQGEVDVVDRRRFLTALDRIGPAGDGEELTIDATELDFIDHHGMLGLSELLERSGRRAVMRTRSAGPARLAEVLGLGQTLRVEVVV